MKSLVFILFLSFCMLFSKDKEVGNIKSCINNENFSLAYTYVVWKKATSKKLSEYGKVIVEDDYDVEVMESEIKKLVFTAKNYKLFSILEEKGFQPHTKNTKNYEKYEGLFCKILERAKIANLPKNKYRYIDGSGNLWKINETEIVKEPMTPEKSSSGIYSGGKPFKKILNLDKFNELKKIIEESLSAKKSQIENREMGSGTVIKLITEGVTEKTVFLSQNSSEKSKLDKFLKNLRE